MLVFLQIIFIYGRNAYFRAKLRGFKQFVTDEHSLTWGHRILRFKILCQTHNLLKETERVGQSIFSCLLLGAFQQDIPRYHCVKANAAVRSLINTGLFFFPLIFNLLSHLYVKKTRAAVNQN